MQTSELKQLMGTQAPMKVVGAQMEEATYAVSVHECHWPQAGEIKLVSGQHCLIELAEAPAAGRARCLVQTADGQHRPAGMLNFMPPQTERKVRWNEGSRQAIVCMMEPERLGLLGAVDWHWGAVDTASTLDVQNERMRTGMRWLAEEITTPSFASGLQINSILTMLAIELHRHCGGGVVAESSVPGKLSARHLSLLKDLVEGSTNPAELSLAALAAACQLPARELSTLFKATAGQTLRSYVAATHIARAKVLLDDADLLIKQVAYGSGFRSAAAFGDAFRRATGLTPLQYRLNQGIANSEAALRRH